MTGLRASSMGLLISAILLTSILTNTTYAQTPSQVEKIRAVVLAINNGSATYKETVRDVQEISLEGAEATYYRSAGDLKKIVTKMFGETFSATGEFYYNDGELIFAFIKNNQYDVQIGSNPPPKVVRSEEQRFYFADGELIRLLVGKNELKSNDERYTKLNQTVTDISVRLIDAERN